MAYRTLAGEGTFEDILMGEGISRFEDNLMGC
jgi:hypothetical protein